MNKILTRDLTSYDLLKAFAVLVMIIDHAAAFNLTITTELRVMTHLTLPIWLFLIGYARSRDTNVVLWIAALAITLSDFIAGMIIFPLNIVFTMLLIRLTIDTCMKTLGGRGIGFWLMNIFFLLIAPFTMLLIEYGTLGMILAIFGYITRRYADDPVKRVTLLFPYLIFTTLSFALVMWIWFLPAGMWVIILFSGGLLVMLGLSQFRPAVFPRLTVALMPPVSWLIRLMGRHTLLIYAGHYILLKLISPWVHPEKFQFLNWMWFPPFHP